MSKPKWDKVDKSTWTRGTYRIERRARDQFLALGPPGEGDDEKTPGHLGCWGKLALAKAACDEHEEGLEGAKATAMAWTEDAEHKGVWLAPGPDDLTYTCQEDTDDKGQLRWFAELDGNEIGSGDGEATLELAQAICQRHRDTELAWEPDGACYVAAHGYHCDPAPDGGWGAWAEEDLLDTFDEAEQAQDCCQEHHRELVGPPELGERDVKPENHGELGDWLIPVQLTEQELAKYGKELGDLYVQLGQQTLAIAQAKEAAKRAVKAAEAEIERLNAEALPVAEMLESGEEHRLVRCHQHKGDGELYYVALDLVTELHRHAVPKGEQQGLWGNGTPPDKPPSKGEAKPHAPPLAWTEDNDDDGTWAARSGPYRVEVSDDGSFVLAVRGDERLFQAGNVEAKDLRERIAMAQDLCAIDAQTRAETDAAESAGEQPDPLPLVKLSWGKIPHQRIWLTKGSRTIQYRIDLQQRPGELIITAGAPNKPSEHTELHRWPLAEVGADSKVIVSAEVKIAKKWCQDRRDSRIRWGVPVLGDDGKPCMLLSIPVEGQPRFQLVRQEPDAEGRDWHAERLGELDQGNTDLLAHQGLEAAQAACQADTDAGRAGQ